MNRICSLGIWNLKVTGLNTSWHLSFMFPILHTFPYLSYFPSYLPPFIPLLLSTRQNYYYYSVVCLTTGPKPPPKRFLHIVRSKASSFRWEYPLLSLRSSSSFLRLLPRLLVTSISPFIFPSITCFRRQFLRKMWPIQLAFLFRISRRIFLCSLTRSNTSSFLTWSIELIFSIFLQHHISKLSRYFWSAARRALERRNISYICQESNPYSLVFSSQPDHIPTDPSRFDRNVGRN